MITKVHSFKRNLAEQFQGLAAHDKGLHIFAHFIEEILPANGDEETEPTLRMIHSPQRLGQRAEPHRNTLLKVVPRNLIDRDKVGHCMLVDTAGSLSVKEFIIYGS